MICEDLPRFARKSPREALFMGYVASGVGKVQDFGLT